MTASPDRVAHMEKGNFYIKNPTLLEVMGEISDIIFTVRILRSISRYAP